MLRTTPGGALEHHERTCTMDERHWRGRWVRATGAGWLLGIPLVVVLALAGEAVGIGGVQVLVGAGMGAGVGLVQARALRGVRAAVGPWVLASVVGLSLPFLVVDVAGAAGVALPYSLQLSVTVGGLVVGAWQERILRAVVGPGSWAWIVASTVGWTLAAGLVAVADAVARSQRVVGIAGALVFLGLVALGGVVLGLVTGVPLARMLARAKDPPSQP